MATASYVVIAAVLCGFVVAGFVGAPLWLWTVLGGLGLWLLHPPIWLWVTLGVPALIFNVTPLRRLLVSRPIMRLFERLKIMPVISAAELTALRAGDVWVEGELFSGRPDFKKLMAQPYPELTTEERAFIDGPVDRVCEMTNDWEVYKHGDLPPAVWEFLKKERFFGMIISKEYGGLGFSALAHSAVVLKLATRCLPLSITVMVPNSLGPAELLNHYGTPEQKKYYLPRLARGEEIPCFALTEPTAGSDAASILASGVVFKGPNGALFLKLNWNKRWITLAGVSTLIGLAFRLRDPENLLGKGVDLGITCALIPRHTPGVSANRRHDPLGTPFFNSPTQGKDVVVSIDAIIGGVERAGQGWKMLMESLAAGRGISLPAQATGSAKYIARVASAHATVRKQFGMSIGRFEGIAEPLARITGLAYLLEAARRYTLGAIDSGKRPPIVTAMAKYSFTEIQRKLVNDAMDILGGQGISEGPRNLMAHAYKAAPISITVEGANILTRSLIVFGQGALRAHPYAFAEVEALAKRDGKAFDRALWGHVGHVVRNAFRSILLSLTRGYLTRPRSGITARYYRKLAWASACFALMADTSMVSLGANLKTRGKTAGRYADILSWMYLATATLKRFEFEGRRKEDVVLLRWSLDYAFAQIQIAFDGLCGSIEIPVAGWIFRHPVRWLCALNAIGRPASDKLDLRLAELIRKPGEQRDRLTDGIYLPDSTYEPLAALERAFKLSVAGEEVSGKLKAAVKAKTLAKQEPAQLAREALSKGILTQSEFDLLTSAEEARAGVIQVDDFGFEDYGARETWPLPAAAKKNSEGPRPRVRAREMT